MDVDAMTDLPEGTQTTAETPRPTTVEHVVRRTTSIEISVATILKVLATILIVWIILQIRSIFFLVFLGMLLAAALYPPIARLERRGWSRGRSLGTVLISFVVLVVLFLAFLIPRLIDQGREFWEQAPLYAEDGLNWLEDRQPDIYDDVQIWIDEQSAQRQNESFVESFDVGGAASVGMYVVSGIGNVIIVLAIAIYLLLDGERIFAWLTRDLSPARRARFSAAVPRLMQVVSGYVMGQGLMSLLFGLFTLVLLSALDVPSALILAMIAAVADAIPQVGVAAAAVPVVILSLTVGLPTAIISFAAYLLYQQVENYVIAPRVFRRTLQISAFVTLIAVLIGGRLLGIFGVLLALPIAAAIPVLEDLWRQERSESRRSDPAVAIVESEGSP
jgi:predicted PurR-regulated permease PerM